VSTSDSRCRCDLHRHDENGSLIGRPARVPVGEQNPLLGELGRVAFCTVAGWSVGIAAVMHRPVRWFEKL
jgi:hypothetical protein